MGLVYPGREEGDVWVVRVQEVAMGEEEAESIDGAAAVGGEGDVGDLEVGEESGDDV